MGKIKIPSKINSFVLNKIPQPAPFKSVCTIYLPIDLFIFEENDQLRNYTFTQ